MARPPLERPSVRVDIVLSLRPGEDDDLLAWFESLPPGARSAAVVTRLRTGGTCGAGEGPVANTADVADVLAGLLF